MKQMLTNTIASKVNAVGKRLLTLTSSLPDV